MSKFEDDLARGCLPTGEPLECLYGTGWWTEMPEEEPEPDPVDLRIAELETRIAELEGLVDQLIEAGDLLAECSDYEGGKIAWDALVKDWKEREE